MKREGKKHFQSAIFNAMHRHSFAVNKIVFIQNNSNNEHTQKKLARTVDDDEEEDDNF